MWTNCRTSYTFMFVTSGNQPNAGDISRYLAGEIDLSSISAVTVEHTEVPGKLSLPPIDESAVMAENRIPRVTSAIWCVLDWLAS
jgi:hypothetical protein